VDETDPGAPGPTHRPVEGVVADVRARVVRDGDGHSGAAEGGVEAIHRKRRLDDGRAPTVDRPAPRPAARVIGLFGMVHVEGDAFQREPLPVRAEAEHQDRVLEFLTLDQVSSSNLL